MIRLVGAKRVAFLLFLRQGEKLGQIFEVLELDAHLHVQCNESE
jgi:hypothetical protein